MKLNSLIIALLLSSSASAFTGEQVIEAAKQAIGLAVFEIDSEDIEAFQVFNDDVHMDAEILYHNDATDSEEVLAYGCHLHGQSVACHESGHVDHKSINFGDFYQGFLSSADAFRKVAPNLGITLDDLLSIKAWKNEDGGHDHGHGHGHKGEEGEVWVKFEYLKNGAPEAIYSMCHHHAGEPQLACHFSFTGEGELQF